MNAPPTGVIPGRNATELDHALPGHAIDRIRDGIPSRNPTHQYGALVSICMSAQLRNWTKNQLETEVCDPYTSKLWVQLSRTSNGKSRPQTTMTRTFDSAWDSATHNLASPDNDYDMTQTAIELAFTWTDHLDDPAIDFNLTDSEEAVLRHVIAETERRQWCKVALPTRQVEEATKLGRQRVRTAMRKLTEREILTQYTKGQRGATSGRAAIYGLNLAGDPVTHINPKNSYGLGEHSMGDQPISRGHLALVR